MLCDLRAESVVTLSTSLMFIVIYCHLLSFIVIYCHLLSFIKTTKPKQQ